MGIIKKASITSRTGQKPVFSCELEFSAEQIGKVFYLDGVYYMKAGRIGEEKGPFEICIQHEIIPDKADYSHTHVLSSIPVPELRFKRFELKLYEMVESYSQGY